MYAGNIHEEKVVKLNIEAIKRTMGWCPNVNPVVGKFQSKNVMFSANNILFTICLVISLNLILAVARNLDYAILIPVLVGILSLLYLIVAITFKAHILIDENGVHLRNFELRDVLLNYRNVKSTTIRKGVKLPIGLIVIGLLLLAAMLVMLLTYSLKSGDWKLTLSIACLLPWLLLVKHKQDKEYHNLDTQLYIQYEDKNRSKRWYELTNTSYYQIITDETTASEIQASIEHYRGAN